MGSSLATPLLIGIFAVGLAASALSAIAVNLQHGYYRMTRDRMLALAKELEIDTRGVASTPGARGERNTFLARIGTPSFRAQSRETCFSLGTL